MATIDEAARPEGELPLDDAPTTPQEVDEPALIQIEKQVMAKVPPELQEPVKRLVLAGMRIMFDPKTHPQMIKQLNASDNLPDNVAVGIAGLISLVLDQAPPVPPPAIVAASLMLMCQALNFVIETNFAEVTDDVIAETTEALMAYMMQKLGIKPEQVQGMPGADEGGQSLGRPAEAGIPGQEPPAPPQGLIDSQGAQ